MMLVERRGVIVGGAEVLLGVRLLVLLGIFLHEPLLMQLLLLMSVLLLCSLLLLLLGIVVPIHRIGSHSGLLHTHNFSRKRPLIHFGINLLNLKPLLDG